MTLPIAKIGGKIRALRKKQAQTLEDLSQTTGLSKGLLSQVERGISQPSLETLWKITKALDTPMGHFFEDVSQVHVDVIRKEDRKQIVFPDSNSIFHLIGPSCSDKVRMLEIILQPREVTDLPSIDSVGKEVIIVLQGELTFMLGDVTHTLKEGDSVFWGGHPVPRLKNESEHPVRCLMTTFEV